VKIVALAVVMTATTPFPMIGARSSAQLYIREHAFKSVIAVDEQKPKFLIWQRHARIGHK